MSKPKNAEGFSRNEMLKWVNSLLKTSYERIEDLHTGVAYCQLVDILDPESIQLKKVKFNAKQEYEFIHNFRLFQKALVHMKNEREVPIAKLVKGRFLDNFEFLQWFRTFFEQNYQDHEYDALKVRDNLFKEQRSNSYLSIKKRRSLKSENNNNNIINNNDKNIIKSPTEFLKDENMTQSDAVSYYYEKLVNIQDIIFKEQKKISASLFKQIVDILHK